MKARYSGQLPIDIKQHDSNKEVGIRPTCVGVWTQELSLLTPADWRVLRILTGSDSTVVFTPNLYSGATIPTSKNFTAVTTVEAY